MIKLINYIVDFVQYWIDNTTKVKYNLQIKDEVRLLRRAGLSLNQIQEKVNVPKTTIRDWIGDIALSATQRAVIQERAHKLLQEGRIKAEKRLKEKKVAREKHFLSEGEKEIGKLSKRELFIAGIALYWAEGFKNRYEHRLGFCNSDPHMINFYLSWLYKTLRVEKSEITARLTLNISYKDKIDEIQKYWSTVTGIPTSQFTKPFFQNTQWRKQYDNTAYYGVLRIHVKESLDKLMKMKGWIQGLKLNSF